MIKKSPMAGAQMTTEENVERWGWGGREMLAHERPYKQMISSLACSRSAISQKLFLYTTDSFLNVSNKRDK